MRKLVYQKALVQNNSDSVTQHILRQNGFNKAFKQYVQVMSMLLECVV